MKTLIFAWLALAVIACTAFASVWSTAAPEKPTALDLRFEKARLEGRLRLELENETCTIWSEIPESAPEPTEDECP